MKKRVFKYKVLLFSFLLSYGSGCSSTPLYNAAAEANFDAVVKLVDSGVSVNEADWLGRTPLHGAAFSGSLRVVKYLVDLGAVINAVDSGLGCTALHIAARKSHLLIVDFLLNRGADTTVLDMFENLPIDMAIDDVVKATLAGVRIPVEGARKKIFGCF